MAKRKRPTINLAKKKAPPPHKGDLEMLFSSPDDAEQTAGLTLLSIRTDAIAPDPDQPRHTFPEDSLRELSDSIKQDGVIQPIEVTQVGKDKYMIVHGERRWRATQLAGLDRIPAVVRRRDYDDVTRFVRQIVENVQREDLNDVDRAAGLLRLRDLMIEEQNALALTETKSDEPMPPWATKVTWSKVGDRLGYSRQRISQLVGLLKLPEEIKDAVREGSISERDTRVYQGLESNKQLELHEERAAGNLSDKEVKQVAKSLKSDPKTSVDEAVERVRRKEVSSAKLASPTMPTPPPVMDDAPVRNHPHIDRLSWIRGHLAKLDPAELTADDRQEAIRLLALIAQDVDSLQEALENYS